MTDNISSTPITAFTCENEIISLTKFMSLLITLSIPIYKSKLNNIKVLKMSTC